MTNDDFRPIDPRTGEPMPPRAQPGYYPDFQSLGEEAYWDAATRRVVLQRVERIPPIRFFSTGEARLLEIVFECLLPQADRDEAHRIPLVPFVDERLFTGAGPGYRYEDMPGDCDAYRRGLRALDALSNELHGVQFEALHFREKRALLQALKDGAPSGDQTRWEGLSPRRLFVLWLHDAIGVYYAHPWAWDEVGFGGPAYPRGYMRLENGEPEPWEAHEKRYEWALPRAWRDEA